MEEDTSHGTSLVVHWLRHCAPNTGAIGSIPGRETKILNTMGRGENQQTQKHHEIIFFTEDLCKVVPCP